MSEDENSVEALFRRGKAKSQLGQTESARLDFLKAIGTLQGARRSFGSFVGRGTRQGSIPKAGAIQWSIWVKA